MQCFGKTAAFTTRWYCTICKKSAIRTRLDTTRKGVDYSFHQWITGTRPLVDIAKAHRCSSRTMMRRFAPCWKERFEPELMPSAGVPLICDGINLTGRTNAVLISRTAVSIVSWYFAHHECFESWFGLFSLMERPSVVVCDGRRGITLAIRSCWEGVAIQRCLFHVRNLVQIRVTTCPKTEAGREILRLAQDLFSVWTRRQKRRWIRRFRKWGHQYRTTLQEKSHGYSPNGRRTWWYTHKSLRSARSAIENSLPHLFTFVGHYHIPRTTNHVEGGTNSVIRELIHRHRGLPLEKKKILVAHFLSSKQH